MFTGTWIKIKKPERQHAKGDEMLAGWLDCNVNTVRKWITGDTMQWRTGARDKIHALHVECLKSVAPLRRLETMDASNQVLGAVALFIVREEARCSSQPSFC